MVAIMLMVFKCCWNQGILSGRRIPYGSVLPRILFFISGVIFILMAILLATEGLTNMQDAVSIFSRSAQDISILVQEAESLISIGQNEIQDRAISVRNSLQQELDGSVFCPADPTLADNADLAELRQQADAAMAVLQNVELIDEQVSALADRVSEAKEAAQRVAKETSEIDITAWQALMIMILLTLVPCLLVSAAILAHFDADVPFQCVLHWFLLPVFIILVILCSIGACVFLPFAIANADFCLPPALSTDPYEAGSPDTTVYRFLDREGFISSDDVVRQVADYYIGQCPADVQNPFEEWSTVLPTLVDVQSKLNSLAGTLNNDASLSQLSLYCGRDYQTVQGLLVEMESLLTVVIDTLQRAWNALSCDIWVPIYHRAVYDGACNTSLKALVWMWSTSLVLAITGWLMLFLRSSYQPTAIQGVAHNRFE
jgi:Tweety